MSIIASWVISRLSLPVIAVLAAFVFYEGVPVVKEIPKAFPIVRLIPVAGPVFDWIALGRVDRERRAGFEAGVMAERSIWTREADRLREEVDAIKEAKTNEIAEIERLYLLESARRAIQTGALKEVINDLEKQAADAANAGRPSCPAISRRLSTALDGVGRSQARNPASDGDNP